MNLQLMRIPPEFTFALVVLAVLVALWRGGPEERAGAAVLAFQAVNGFVPMLSWSTGLPADLIALAVFLPLVLLGRRYWTIWALASVVLSLVTDLIDALVVLSLWSYHSAQLTWYYVLIGSVLVGGLTRRAPR